MGDGATGTPGSPAACARAEALLGADAASLPKHGRPFPGGARPPRSPLHSCLHAAARDVSNVKQTRRALLRPRQPWNAVRAPFPGPGPRRPGAHLPASPARSSCPGHPRPVASPLRPRGRRVCVKDALEPGPGQPARPPLLCHLHVPPAPRHAPRHAVSLTDFRPLPRRLARGPQCPSLAPGPPGLGRVSWPSPPREQGATQREPSKL